MLSPHKLLEDQEYLDFHLRDLQSCQADELGLGRPVVVQLCGNDPQVIVKAARNVERLCDAIDLNLGCPQEHARDGYYGAYLLGQKDWPRVEQIVSSMSNSLSVPISAKLRLCTPTALTPVFASRLAANGASWITLHARHVSARRRRAGAADLDAVKTLKEALVDLPIVSNGNVRTWGDVVKNREQTAADGIMVGETLLGNPCLFENRMPDPVLISFEYLDLCRAHPGTASLPTVRTHIRHFVEFQCARRPWYPKFRAALNHCETLEEIETLLRRKVAKWRGGAGAARGGYDDEDNNDNNGHNTGIDEGIDDLSLIR